jgi:amino acid transporter
VTETPKGALGLKELVAMGIGGMIGGGIFSILGLAVDVAGHAAPLAFLSGSLIALAAGYSYAKLALAFRSDGASFTYLERAFPTRPEVAGIAGWTVVVGYIGTLALYFFTVDSSRFVPVFDRGISGALLGGALIFVAYEGFQLITNAVLETRDPDRNVPRGIYGSILITSAIYIAIAVVAVGTLDPAAIKAADEYALAVVARPILGKAGVLLVDLAALLATSSAINATLFGSARLASEMAAERFAPAVFSFRSRTDVPVAGVTVITILAAFFAGLGSLAVIAAFSSMTFLLVSIGVCVANLRLRRTTGSAALPIVAALGLMSVTVALLAYYLAANDPMALAFTAAVYLSTTVAHVTFERLRRGSG